MSNEPGPISDEAPKGRQADATESATVKRPIIKIKKFVKVVISFDENMKEFKLWDFLYSEHDRYELDVDVDWANRNQIYQIKGSLSDMRSLIKFLRKSQILFYLT